MSRKLVIYGCGGHGRVLAEVAAAADFTCAGFVDDGVPAGTLVDGLEVLGDRAWLERQSSDELQVALGLGGNALRERVASQLVRRFALPPIVHPSAVVSPRAFLGAGAVVFPLAVLNTGCRVGEGAIVNTGAVIEHDVVLGPFSHVSPNATLAGAAHVGRRAHVGAGATILPMRGLGDDSTLGAGSVLVHDIPAAVIAVGAPARVRRAVL